MQANIARDIGSWRAQLNKGTLEFAVLLLLQKEPTYGLDIVDSLNQLGLSISRGTVYQLLGRLREEGKVKTEWADGSLGHARRVYEVTAHGEKVVTAMVSTWSEVGDAFAFLMQAGKKR